MNHRVVSSFWSSWRPTVWAVGATPLLLFLAVATTGLGHGYGTLVLSWSLFPFGTFVALGRSPFDENNVGGLLAGLLQFPAYALIARVGARAQRMTLASLVIIIAHLLAMAVAAPRVW